MDEVEYVVLSVASLYDPDSDDLSGVLPGGICRVLRVNSEAEASLALLERTAPVPDFLVLGQKEAHDSSVGVLLQRTLEYIAPFARFRVRHLSGGRAVLLGALSKRAQESEAHAPINIKKPVIHPKARLIPELRRSNRSHQLQEPIRHDLGSGYVFLALSAEMKQLYFKALTLAEVGVPILLLGESGTGKEVLARLIHAASPRKNAPMMRVNCAALPPDLLESELFGYEAGAFSGAVQAKPGKLEVCDGGTLFLDEIGEMSAALQAKLLHVLQDGEYSRLGARTSRHADVQVIAATNINMENAVHERTFREDLYYRLSAFVLNLPPLKERKSEIPFLIDYFRLKVAQQLHLAPFDFDEELVTAACAYSWPGNLRELINFMQRITIFRDREIALSELGKSATSKAEPLSFPKPMVPVDTGMRASTHQARMQVERDLILRTLNSTGWNRKHAAGQLKISYKTLLCKIREYGLEQERIPA